MFDVHRPLETAAPEYAGVLRRALTAMLRHRARWLRAVVKDGRALRATSFLPVALHTSFARPGLKDEAPGVAGLGYRPSWPALARAFGLPPPFRLQRGPPLVEAVFASPVGEVVEIIVLLTSGARRGAAHAVAERAHAALSALRLPPGSLDLRVTDASKLASDPEAFHRTALCGALVAGRLSSATWDHFERASHGEIHPAVVASIATSLPSPLAALALTLVCERTASGPLAAAAHLVRHGERPLRLADPAVLAALWAAHVAPENRVALERAVALARPLRKGRQSPPVTASASEVLAVGRQLALAAAVSIRRSCRALGPKARSTWREAIGTDVPRALLGALGESLGPGALLKKPERAGNRFEVSSGNTVIGWGSTAVQSYARALSLLSLAAPVDGADLFDQGLDPPWRALAPFLSQPTECPTLVLVVEPAQPVAPPFVPLNAGQSGALGFSGALAVILAPGRRPSARVLTAEQAVAKLLHMAARGYRVEVIPARSEAYPVTARLSKLKALAREGGCAEAVPVALEIGGRVVVPRGRQLLWYSLERFAARPRIFSPDPDAPSLALVPAGRRAAGLTVIECRVELLDERRVAVLYVDSSSGHLREVVFADELEEHLRESRAILQRADPSTVLAVRLSDGVEPAVRKLTGSFSNLALAVRGGLPDDLWVEISGKRYGGLSGLSLERAALSLVAQWPRGDKVRLAVKEVTVFVGKRRAAGLLALYARSVALRRLHIHLSQTLRSYQLEESRRWAG